MSFTYSDRANKRHAFMKASCFLDVFFPHLGREVGNDVITTCKLPLKWHHQCSIRLYVIGCPDLMLLLLFNGNFWDLGFKDHAVPEQLFSKRPHMRPHI